MFDTVRNRKPNLFDATDRHSVAELGYTSVDVDADGGHHVGEYVS